MTGCVCVYWCVLLETEHTMRHAQDQGANLVKTVLLGNLEHMDKHKQAEDNDLASKHVAIK